MRIITRRITPPDPPEDMEEFREWANKCHDLVPHEFRHTAKIFIEIEDDYHGPIIAYLITYESPETETERLTRESNEALRKQQEEKRQRAEFERLKKIFS